MGQDKDKRFYEEDIKEAILEKRHMFLSEPDEVSKNNKKTHTVIFEKGIAVGSTIADCMVFNSNGIITGIEIKTERDSTRRLNKQLKNYSLVCDYVYVLCHDTHVEKVEEILKTHKHFQVGIVSYTEFRGEVIMGIYKHPTRSVNKRVEMSMQMLWKIEVSQLLSKFNKQMQSLEEFGIKVNTVSRRQMEGMYTKSSSTNNKRISKTELIKTLVYRLGELESSKLLCYAMIQEDLHPEHFLKFRHFEKPKS